MSLNFGGKMKNSRDDLFGFGLKIEPTLGEPFKVGEPKMTAEMTAIVNALLAKNQRKPGRPRKPAGKDVDTLRATVIYVAAREYPEGPYSIRRWIEIAKEAGAETGGELGKLFPVHQELEQSVSRGLKKIGAPKDWNKKLAK